MNGAGNYSVEPDALRDFAETLKSQTMAIERLHERLAGISDAAGTTNLFGAFNEAASLAQLHMTGLQYLWNLIDQVESLYKFGDKVAREAADGYEGTDLSGAAGLRPFMVDDGTPVGAQL